MEKCVIRVDDRSFYYNSPRGTDLFEDIEETGFYFDVLENKIEGFGDLYGIEKLGKRHKSFRKTICEFLAQAWYWNKIDYNEIEYLRKDLDLIDIGQAYLIDRMKNDISTREEMTNRLYDEMKEDEERILLWVCLLNCKNAG